MAINSGFFMSVNGDRKYNAAFFAEYFATFIGNGVFPNPSNGLQIISNGDMTVTMKAGKAWINGYYINNDADYILTLENADGVLKRIDRIVLQLNFLNREIVPVVKKGTFASSPVAPVLKRDADAYEIALADVLINNGAISISQANITDQRLNTALCGIVHGTVDQVDTTTIFNQYLSWYQNFTTTKNTEYNAWATAKSTEFDTWQAAEKADFDAWFATIQDILDDNVAANLSAQITALQGEITTHKNDNVKHITPEERTAWNSKETPDGARKKVEQTEYKKYKSGKDAEGIFTTVEYKRNDGTLAAKAVLSGGTSPKYTTRTHTFYALDGSTVEKTTTRTLSYDADGELISEV